MKTSKTYSRKPWSKMLSPAQLDAIMREYDAGIKTEALCEKYRVSRSWLYRERKRWMENAGSKENVTCLRAEIARLERVICNMAQAGFGAEFAKGNEVANQRKAS